MLLLRVCAKLCCSPSPRRATLRMCCCKRTRTGCCVCCANGQGQFFAAAILALIAFGGAGWILSISTREFPNPTHFAGGPRTIESTDFFQIGLLYPIAIATISDITRCGSITDTALYSSDASKLCEPVRNLGLTPETCKRPGVLHVPGGQAGCTAATEICGAKFRTAAAFSFMQCLAAFIAGILIAPALPTPRRSCGAQVLAAFSAVSGITALAIVYAVTQELRHAHNGGHPVFPGIGEGFPHLCGGGAGGAMLNSTITSEYVGPLYSWYLSSIALFLTLAGMYRLWRYGTVIAGGAGAMQAQARAPLLAPGIGGDSGGAQQPTAGVYQPCVVPTTVTMGLQPPSAPPMQNTPRQYDQQDAFVPMALPLPPDTKVLEPDVVSVTCPDGMYGDGTRTIRVQHPSSMAFYDVPVPTGIGPGQQFTAKLPALPKSDD